MSSGNPALPVYPLLRLLSRFQVFLLFLTHEEMLIGDLPYPLVKPMAAERVLSKVLLCFFLLYCYAQLCPTLCDTKDCSPPASSVCGIFKARIWEWVGSCSLLQGILKTSNSHLWCLLHLAGRFFTNVPPSKVWRDLKVTQWCLTLCNPMDCSLPGSSVHRILQARILEWVVVPFSRRSSQPRDRTQVSCIAGRFFTSWATREAFRWSEKGSSFVPNCLKGSFFQSF